MVADFLPPELGILLIINTGYVKYRGSGKIRIQPSKLPPLLRRVSRSMFSRTRFAEIKNDDDSPRRRSFPKDAQVANPSSGWHVRFGWKPTEQTRAKFPVDEDEIGCRGCVWASDEKDYRYVVQVRGHLLPSDPAPDVILLLIVTQGMHRRRSSFCPPARSTPGRLHVLRLVETPRLQCACAASEGADMARGASSGAGIDAEFYIYPAPNNRPACRDTSLGGVGAVKAASDSPDMLAVSHPDRTSAIFEDADDKEGEYL